MKRRGLVIGDMDTAELGFTMTELSLQLPEVVSRVVEIDGMDGKLDISDENGGPHYRTRQLRAVFELSSGTAGSRQPVLDRLVNACHGKRLPIRHPDFPDTRLTGRCSLSIDFNRPAYAQLSLQADCDPFRMEPVPAFREIPVLTLEDNDFSEANTTVTTYGNAEASVMPSSGVETASLLTTAGAVGTFGVFRVALAPNTRYFVAGHLAGAGKWCAAPENEPNFTENPFVTTGDDGWLYIRLYRLEDTGSVSLQYVLIVRDDKMSSFDFGACRTMLQISPAENPVPVSWLTAVGRNSTRTRNYTSGGQPAPQGVRAVCVWRPDSPEAPGTAVLRAQRGWL